MAATSAPYGLKPVARQGSLPFAGATREYVLTTNSSTAIFTGDLVTITAGQLAPVANTPTTTRNTNTPIGVFVGCKYNDGNTIKFAQYLPANAVTNGYTDIRCYVVDDPEALFVVQASGAVTRADIGKNAPLTNFGQGSTATGNSKVQLDQSGINTTNTLAVRIVDLIDNAFSAPGDAYTDCVVVFNQGVHAYRNATAA